MKTWSRFGLGAFLLPVLSGCQAFGPKLSGQVYCGDGGTRTPAVKAQVELKKNLQVVATTSTGADGKYVLKAPETLDGGYILSARAECGNGSKVLPAEPVKSLKDQNLSLFK